MSTTQDSLFESSDAIEALQELEQNTRSAVIRKRSGERVEIDIPVVIRPANSSDRSSRGWAGVTANVSGTGCMVVTAAPLVPGDVYAVDFDDEELELPLTLGRCLRSRMIREDAFEAGLRFFSPIDLAMAIAEENAN